MTGRPITAINSAPNFWAICTVFYTQSILFKIYYISFTCT